jgi:hypothetical protein
MARIEPTNQNLRGRLDVLKINYEKYFCGIERVEPYRDREAVRRTIRELGEEGIKNATQQFKFQGLKARFQTFELYWTRNLKMMEAGTHPKMRFKADKKATQEAGQSAEERLSAEQEAVLRERQERMEREERGYRLVYEKYLEARKQCGQSADVGFEAVREALSKQVRQIKSTYNVESVKFRVVVEEGKAKLKAVPVQNG